jgi:hypothetical protein
MIGSSAPGIPAVRDPMVVLTATVAPQVESPAAQEWPVCREMLETMVLEFCGPGGSVQAALALTGKLQSSCHDAAFFPC